jgi:hypothetical protein
MTTQPSDRDQATGNGTFADRTPGDRPSPEARRRLERPPGERYEPRLPPEPPEPPGSPVQAFVFGGAVALLGAVTMTLLLAVFAVEAGLVIIAGVTGLFVAVAVRRGGRGSMPPRRRTGLSIVLAIGGVALGFVGTWLYGLSAGSPLGLLEYVDQVFGLLAVLLPVVAAVLAWLGNR